MATGVYIWSQTQATNASADSNVNWTEGQAPSTVNDSARNMMASIAKWRDDFAGSIVTSGGSAAYTAATSQVFDSLAHLNGQIITFTAHTTNTGSGCSLNVDGLGAKNIRSATGIDLPAGTLIAGTPYTVLYNNSDQIFYLHNFFGQPYSIPIGATIDYWLPTAPNSSFVFPYGQAISRTTYATLFAAMGTTYGGGDGSTTFNLPDLRGRVTASPDNMGGGVDPARLASGALAGVRNSIGGAGGEATHLLTTAEMPSHTHANTLNESPHSHAISPTTATQGFGVAGGGGNGLANSGAAVTQAASTGITITNAAQGGGGAHNIMQPTILCNRIMRII